ncbi:esterase-like activity of phytase family protein [Aquimarina sp. 2201CG5-10]|uniref:esterase-like activity of phytase family protein n=1 Tax=Aquimarina callyspongiae TaxID=3098150 RepID=UPI002AB36F3C|nr:esterase-like activity of phytase family protein [Aquimarina sp. 2201CG5-10]MDY8138434.1 esterase-like activity of phytase family protein [Aquimarina sp. 2201CG5-10]
MLKGTKWLFPIILLCLNCSSSNDTNNQPPVNDSNTISTIEFIDEFIIPNQEINGVPIGGLSGIDYHDGKWYLICDTSTPPIRYYEANISYTKDAIQNVGITSMVEIKDESGAPLASGIVDPESIRLDVNTGTILYTSEGSINNGIDPGLIEISTSGNQIRNLTLPDHFKANTTDDLSGPRHNGVLEGLSLSFDDKGYWVSMELPLIEDGPEPTTADTESPVRITFIDKASGVAQKQFAYELDPVAREPALGTSFEVNGLVEILEYDENQFLALERSFSSGYIDGGNTVKIYKVDITNATNTLDIESLSNTTHTKATKTLLFNFDTIRGQLTNSTVDNIEGISLGSKLDDGSRTLVVVSDNNFNSFFPQLNQLIVFKIIP